MDKPQLTVLQGGDTTRAPSLINQRTQGIPGSALDENTVKLLLSVEELRLKDARYRHIVNTAASATQFLGAIAGAVYVAVHAGKDSLWPLAAVVATSLALWTGLTAHRKRQRDRMESYDGDLNAVKELLTYPGAEHCHMPGSLILMDHTDSQRKRTMVVSCADYQDIEIVEYLNGQKVTESVWRKGDYDDVPTPIVETLLTFFNRHPPPPPSRQKTGVEAAVKTLSHMPNPPLL